MYWHTRGTGTGTGTGTGAGTGTGHRYSLELLQLDDRRLALGWILKRPVNYNTILCTAP